MVKMPRFHKNSKKIGADGKNDVAQTVIMTEIFFVLFAKKRKSKNNVTQKMKLYFYSSFSMK